MSEEHRERLGELLIKANLIDDIQLRVALQAHGIVTTPVLRTDRVRLVFDTLLPTSEADWTTRSAQLVEAVQVVLQKTIPEVE